MLLRFLIAGLFFLISTETEAQKEFLYSKDGKPVLNRRAMLFDCLRSMNKDRSDPVALNVCECYVNKIDGHFTLKEYKKHTSKGIVNLEKLINEDSLFKNDLDKCFAASGKSILLSAEGFSDRSIARCVEGLQKATNKKLDTNKLKEFCSCQLELIKEKKLSDDEIMTANDPNSLFFFEVSCKCGDPFAEKEELDKAWNTDMSKFIRGPLSDTISILTLNGMSYLKLKIGSLIKIWLFDTGASDMLINKEMEAILQKENIITDKNYLGIGEYEMANGVIDSCRRYSVDDIRIGKYHVDNIIIAVSDKAKRTILGRSLLNKFSSWALDNKTNTLILHK